MSFTAPPCKAALDLGIIADVSQSVGNENLPKLKAALESLVEKFEPSLEGTNVGLITFAKSAELHFAFKDKGYQSTEAIKAKIEDIDRLYLQTRTDKALIMAHEELFSEAGGDRPEKPNVLLVFTDGRPTKKAGYKEFDETVPPLTNVSAVTKLGKQGPLIKCPLLMLCSFRFDVDLDTRPPAASFLIGSLCVAALIFLALGLLFVLFSPLFC